MIMADEQRVPGAGADDRGEKRKCDDFTALYSMDTTGPAVPARALGDPSGKLVIVPSLGHYFISIHTRPRHCISVCSSVANVGTELHENSLL